MNYKVYIAGPVSGLDFDKVKRAFSTAADLLKAKGCEVVNPIELVPDPETEWKDAMRSCIKALADCDAIALLEGWQESKGARVEFELARSLQFPTIIIPAYEPSGD